MSNAHCSIDSILEIGTILHFLSTFSTDSQYRIVDFYEQYGIYFYYGLQEYTWQISI